MRVLGTLILMLSPYVHGQSLHPSLMEEVGRDNLPSNTLGADDLIAISVYDAPEFTRTIRVEPDGMVRLPLLSASIVAAGLVPAELERRVTQELVDGGILVDPIVKITVVEYHSRPISVMGAVHKPLTFQAVGTVTLLEALARAEGITADAGTEIIVSRPQSSPDARGEGSASLLERIPLNRLLKEADPTVNYQLHGGEEIRVPEAGKIFVVGNVHKPGAFPVRDAGDNSILKLVALSEGLTPYAARFAYIYRRDDRGAKQEIPIALDKIMERKAPDVPLQVDDVLYIPDNKTRRNTMSVIDRVTSFGANTASGVLIWRK